MKEFAEAINKGLYFDKMYYLKIIQRWFFHNNP